MDGRWQSRSWDAQADVHPPGQPGHRGAVDAKSCLLPQAETNKQSFGQAGICQRKNLSLFKPSHPDTPLANLSFYRPFSIRCTSTSPGSILSVQTTFWNCHIPLFGRMSSKKPSSSQSPPIKTRRYASEVPVIWKRQVDIEIHVKSMFIQNALDVRKLIGS